MNISNLKKPPEQLDGAKVLFYVELKTKHRRTGRVTHYIEDKLMPSVPFLALCQYAGTKQAYIFHCDSKWNVIQDDLCDSVEDAFIEAAEQFEGLYKTDWIKTEYYEL